MFLIQQKVIAITFVILLVTSFVKLDFKVDALEPTQLQRSPQQVYSMQPVLVYAFYNGTFSSMKLRVTADIDTSVSRTGIIDIPNPQPRTIDITMVPAGWASNWYVAGIPGLPSTTVSATVESGIGIYRQVISFTITVTSKVTYTLLVDGSANGSDSYAVLEGGLERKAPPFVFATIYDTINDPSIIRETLGLGPKGWSLSSQSGLKTLIVAADDKGEQGLIKVLFEYSVTSAPWIQTTLNDDPIMDAVRSFSSAVNNDLNEVKSKIRTVKSDFDLSSITPALSIKNALIPAQAAGNYVRFRANATDIDGNKASSPMGLYYTVNKASNARILIIDPHVWLWLYKENTFQFVDTINRNIDYSAPSDLTNRIKPALKMGQAVRDYGLEPFHHWEYLGENYDLYIAYPNSKLTDQLSQRWNMFILSNLWLGYSSDNTKEPWDWDLIDLGAFEKLSDYVRANHTGTIATHGSLSDWIIWKGCDEKQKVGTRGHVGDNIGNINILKESTVAGLLGIPHLALFEVARDTVAQSLCSVPQTSPLGRAVGSTPLQVPYVPFNGTMKVRDGIRDLGWNLPQEFTINTPSLYNQFGKQSYTQVGWQLAMPSELVSPTWKRADEARTSADRFYQKLSFFMENATNLRAPSSDIRRNLGDSLSNRLRDLHASIVSASINGTRFDMAVKVPENNQATKLSLDVRDVYNQLLQMSPVRLAAISKDSLAGIITYDKYWNRNGYRSVYFSFEPEASEGTIAKTLLVQAMEWSMKWEFKDVSTLLGNAVRISKEKATKFNEELANQKGIDRFSNSIILNEMGGTAISISVSSPTKLNLLIVHPTSDKISVNASSSAEIIGTPKVADRATSLALKVSKPGKITIMLKADPDSALNPAYLVVREESFDFSISLSQSSLSIMQGSSAATSVNLMSAQGISQQTSLSVSGLPSGVTTSFNPTAGTPNFTSSITLATSSTTPAGTYAVTVSGTSGGVTRSVTFTLNILSMMVPPQPAPQPVPQPAPQPQPAPAPAPQPAPQPAPPQVPPPQPQQPPPQPPPQQPAPVPAAPPPQQQLPQAPIPQPLPQPPPAAQKPAVPAPEQPPPAPVAQPQSETPLSSPMIDPIIIVGGIVVVAVVGVALALLKSRRH